MGFISLMIWDTPILYTAIFGLMVGPFIILETLNLTVNFIITSMTNLTIHIPIKLLNWIYRVVMYMLHSLRTAVRLNLLVMGMVSI